jgi:hypothetical protein
LTNIAGYLKQLFEKIKNQGEERLKFTLIRINTLEEKLAKFSESKALVLKPTDSFASIFRINNIKVSGAKPGNVNFNIILVGVPRCLSKRKN